MMTFFVLTNKLILEIKSQERKYVWEWEIEKNDAIMLIKKRKSLCQSFQINQVKYDSLYSMNKANFTGSII